jgi:hypothetical protein
MEKVNSSNRKTVLAATNRQSDDRSFLIQQRCSPRGAVPLSKQAVCSPHIKAPFAVGNPECAARSSKKTRAWKRVSRSARVCGGEPPPRSAGKQPAADFGSIPRTALRGPTSCRSAARRYIPRGYAPRDAKLTLLDNFVQ